MPSEVRLPTHALLVAALVAMLAPITRDARAQDTTRPRGVVVGLTYDPSSKPGIVVLPVSGAFGDSVRSILQRDLDYSDRFAIIPIEVPGGAVNYPLFSRLGARVAVQATLTQGSLHVALHNVEKQGVSNVDDFALPERANSHEWRIGVHGVADEIERWITGQKGIAQTRVAYMDGSRLRIVDSDGEGDESMPVAANALSPAWNPAGTMLAYSTWGTSSRIMVVDLRTRRSRAMANATPSNTNLSPVFSVDGSSIVYSHAGESGTDLYLVPVADDAPARRLSVGQADNVGPTFSPDGRKIAFTSGRSGHPEIYIMDADGTNPDLLTSFDFGDKNYRSDPDWSPDGRLLAFQSQSPDGRFQIMTISLRDRSTKVHTSEGSNEQPSWAPDGRHLVFTSTRSGTRQLWVLDTDSGRMRQLTRASSASLAAWSPRLNAGGVAPSGAATRSKR